MIANEGSDPQSGGGRPESAGKVPPLNKDTDMVIFELFLSGFCSTFANGSKCLTTDWSKVEEDVAAKAKRIKDFAVTNGRVNGAMYQACAGNPEAIAVLVQHAQEDPLEKNAFVLFQMLKKKFTKKTDERLQSLVNQLNTLDAMPGEEPPAMLERFNNLCVAINSVDRAQLPTELKLIHVLKNAIKSQFGLLSANVKLAIEPWTLVTLKEKIFEWELKDERILMGLPRSTQERAQAHFSAMAGQGRGKPSNQNRNHQSESNFKSDLECWNCKKKGHKSYDCQSASNGEFGPSDGSGPKRNFDSSANSGDHHKHKRGGGGGGGGAK